MTPESEEVAHSVYLMLFDEGAELGLLEVLAPWRPQHHVHWLCLIFTVQTDGTTSSRSAALDLWVASIGPCTSMVFMPTW
jgi:hypothetical protein